MKYLKPTPQIISSLKMSSLVCIPRFRAVPPIRKRNQPMVVRSASSIMKAKKRRQNPPYM
ncbi:MAG TPA: hypothetical protein PLS89_04730 [Syntrophales bacterium]|nr:hypothetical protein [Syntrophales bacterium]